MAQEPQIESRKPMVHCGSQRPEFLTEVYVQTSGHLGRHINGLWQSAGVAAAAFATVSLPSEQASGPLVDYLCALVMVLCGWLAATAIDGSNWFNRNIGIIRNIERIFLTESDRQLIHPYFDLPHRPAGAIANVFRIQIVLALAIALVLLGYHAATRATENPLCIGAPMDLSKALPYAIAMAVTIACFLFWLSTKEQERKFIAASPGAALLQTSKSGPVTPEMQSPETNLQLGPISDIGSG